MMALEIEWKFLVTRLPAIPPGVPGVPIEQAYLNPGTPTVRARLKGARGFLTIKGPARSLAAGPGARDEYEYEIPADDARALIAMSALRVQKRRHTLASGIELDIFEGPLAGLVLAELEVDRLDAPVPPPPDGWEWRDVTDDQNFTNRALAERGLPPGTPLCVFG